MNELKKGRQGPKSKAGWDELTAPANDENKAGATADAAAKSASYDGFERLILRIHGRVQGVGYRATAAEKAMELGVTGWVRNLDNGVVELQAEGTPEQLDRLLLWCRKGPRLARVHEVDIWRSAATGEFHGFRVR